MTAKELIKLLQQFPTELEVQMEVRGEVGFPTDVDMETGGTSSWLLITDFPVDIKEHV